jgi:ADP-ribose pyrophosphatase YjhB (NUDIX family)
LIETWTRKPLGLLLRAIQRVRILVWSITKPDIDGAHGIAVTPAGAIVLVKMRYARGWHLPGGGRKKGESARDNVLRELREEIGMTGYSDVQLARTTQDVRDFRRDSASVFILWDVTYQPAKWSLEIEEVMTADLAHLPVDISLRALGWIASVRDVLEAAR